MKKYNYDLKSAKNHEFMVLIPDTNIEVSSAIRNSFKVGENKELKMFSYSVHDDFKDLRGKNRY